MIRTFNTHKIRTSTELDGFWKIKNPQTKKEYELLVPGGAEAIMELQNFQGVLQYYREFELEQEQNMLFTFHGVSFWATVFLDEVEIARHYNAFTAFTAFVPSIKAGNHVLRVEVDNRFSEASSLHIPNDYFSYNAINRPVQMDVVGNEWIEYVHATPLEKNNGWEVQVTGQIHSLQLQQGMMAEIEIDGIKEMTQIAADGSFVTTIELKKATSWSPETPHLYFVTTHLLKDGVIVDDLIERTGFRSVKVSDGKILLNEKPVFLKGFCRHEDAPIWGNALPFEMMVHDIDILKHLNCNSVRTSHYPNDQRFLDLCDEQGILVWEENHARGLSEQDMQNPSFKIQCKECNEEMVLQHYNHPSIYVWGILNECASDTPYGRECYAEQFAQIRALDQTRPLTFASCKFFTDICLDLVDIVSMNLYAGWYHDTPPQIYVKQISEWVKRVGGQNKPLIISEFGAGAIYGFHDYLGRIKWSEERQADLLEEQITAYLNDPDVQGLYIWQLTDCKVCESWAEKRPKCENNKGVVDRYRRPKMAYECVKKLFESKDMII